MIAAAISRDMVYDFIYFSLRVLNIKPGFTVFNKEAGEVLGIGPTDDVPWVKYSHPEVDTRWRT